MDDDTCPLCCEPYELTDKCFQPCDCGFQVCMFCWNKIREVGSGQCPGCRSRYSDEPKLKVAAAEIRRQHQAQAKLKQAQLAGQQAQPRSALGGGGFGAAGGTAGTRLRSSGTGLSAHIGNGPIPKELLRDIRVVQRNLVYVIGLSPSYAREAVLRKSELFGQYGRVMKVVVNRAALPAAEARLASAAAYITYAREADARLAILAVDGFVHDGRVVRCSYGTTKYCHQWLRDSACTSPDCLYLHEPGDSEMSFSREEMLTHNSYGRVFSELVHPAAPGYTVSMPNAGAPAVNTGLGPGGVHVTPGCMPPPPSASVLAVMTTPGSVAPPPLLVGAAQTSGGAGGGASQQRPTINSGGAGAGGTTPAPSSSPPSSSIFSSAVAASMAAGMPPGAGIARVGSTGASGHRQPPSTGAAPGLWARMASAGSTGASGSGAGGTGYEGPSSIAAAAAEAAAAAAAIVAPSPSASAAGGPLAVDTAAGETRMPHLLDFPALAPGVMAPSPAATATAVAAFPPLGPAAAAAAASVEDAVVWPALGPSTSAPGAQGFPSLPAHPTAGAGGGSSPAAAAFQSHRPGGGATAPGGKALQQQQQQQHRAVQAGKGSGAAGVTVTLTAPAASSAAAGEGRKSGAQHPPGQSSSPSAVAAAGPQQPPVSKAAAKRAAKAAAAAEAAAAAAAHSPHGAGAGGAGAAGRNGAPVLGAVGEAMRGGSKHSAATAAAAAAAAVTSGDPGRGAPGTGAVAAVVVKPAPPGPAHPVVKPQHRREAQQLQQQPHAVAVRVVPPGPQAAAAAAAATASPAAAAATDVVFPGAGVQPSRLPQQPPLLPPSAGPSQFPLAAGGAGVGGRQASSFPIGFPFASGALGLGAIERAHGGGDPELHGGVDLFQLHALGASGGPLPLRPDHLDGGAMMLAQHQMQQHMQAQQQQQQQQQIMQQHLQLQQHMQHLQQLQQQHMLSPHLGPQPTGHPPGSGSSLLSGYMAGPSAPFGGGLPLLGGAPLLQQQGQGLMLPPLPQGPDLLSPFRAGAVAFPSLGGDPIFGAGALPHHNSLLPGGSYPPHHPPAPAPIPRSSAAPPFPDNTVSLEVLQRLQAALAEHAQRNSLALASSPSPPSFSVAPDAAAASSSSPSHAGQHGRLGAGSSGAPSLEQQGRDAMALVQDKLARLLQQQQQQAAAAGALGGGVFSNSSAAAAMPQGGVGTAEGGPAALHPTVQRMDPKVQRMDPQVFPPQTAGEPLPPQAPSAAAAAAAAAGMGGVASPTSHEWLRRLFPAVRVSFASERGIGPSGEGEAQRGSSLGPSGPVPLAAQRLHEASGGGGNGGGGGPGPVGDAFFRTLESLESANLLAPGSAAAAALKGAREERKAAQLQGQAAPPPAANGGAGAGGGPAEGGDQSNKKKNQAPKKGGAPPVTHHKKAGKQQQQQPQQKQ